jgi:hypothetical protein
VRSSTGCGRLVDCTIDRTLTAPSSSINLRIVKRRSGENYIGKLPLALAMPGGMGIDGESMGNRWGIDGESMGNRWGIDGESMGNR